MRTAVGLEDGLGLDGDRCMQDAQTLITLTLSLILDSAKHF